MGQVVMLIQMFEWLDMVYIIQTQRHRLPGEIYYQHNMEQTKNFDQAQIPEDIRKNAYRRKEIWLKNAFYTSLGLCTCFDLIAYIWL